MATLSLSSNRQPPKPDAVKPSIVRIKIEKRDANGKVIEVVEQKWPQQIKA